MGKYVYVQCYATQPRYLEADGGRVQVPNDEFPQPAFAEAIVEAGSYEEALNKGAKLREAGDPRLQEGRGSLMNDHAVEITGELIRGYDVVLRAEAMDCVRKDGLLGRALSVIEESDGADEHAELVAELRAEAERTATGVDAADGEELDRLGQDLADSQEELARILGRLKAVEDDLAEVRRRIAPVVP